MSELKPCPFCGSGYIDTGCLTVGCCRCGANGPEGYEGTAETWNDRPIEDALRAEVKRLKAKLAKYTEPLTDEQADAVVQEFDLLGYHPKRAILFDAAIRRVRRGE